MFERFTERARETLVSNQAEARALRHSHVGSEHLLLGLLHDPDGQAARVLTSFDISLDETRLAVTRYVAAGKDPPHGQLPFTPRSKQVLERAGKESLALGHNYVGTEHILLALAGVNERSDEHPTRFRP